MKLVAWFLALSLLCSALAAENSLPVVSEHYTAIAVVTSAEDGYSKVFFVRNGRVVADRLLVDRMVWSCQDGRFAVAWDDYARTCAHRIITADTMTRVTVDGWEASTNEWWNMANLGTDLKQP